MWVCPVCRHPLAEQGKSLVCRGGHRFDVAREGYVNLLPANRKQSRQPGDSRDMLAARRRIHEAGLYKPLAAEIQQRMTWLTDPRSRVLDLGCGDGYFSAAIRQVLPQARLCGVDIAKSAVKLAARLCPGADFAVASAFDVPLADSDADLVISIFAPTEGRELSRLLAPGGFYLKVTPAPRHLWELRCLLYDQARPHPTQSQLLGGFESLVDTRVDYPLELGGQLLRDLVAMTPYAHRGQRQGRDKLEKLDSINMQMSFDISLQRGPVDQVPGGNDRQPL